MHSYVLYPLFVCLLAGIKRSPSPNYSGDDLPFVSVLLPVHDEEKVITQKLTNLMAANYPSEKIEIIVGSDASSDATDNVVSEFARNHQGIKFVRLDKRSGKGAVLNVLAQEATGDILVITDADIILDAQAILELISPFQDLSVGLVDATMRPRALSDKNVSKSESKYISIESSIKAAEGKAFKAMMGSFGGCFALRKSLFCVIPAGTMVDDFFLTMKVLEAGSGTVTSESAIVYQDLLHREAEEFRRKVRIAVGNFQNLVTFSPLLFRCNAVSFCFFSHKVLRWAGPFLLLTAYLCSFLLSLHSGALSIFGLFFWGTNAVLTLALLNRIAPALGRIFPPISFLHHFVLANLALTLGLWQFISQTQNGIWRPTERDSR